VAHRDPLKHRDLISNLKRVFSLILGGNSRRKTDHMFSSSHEPFVDDLRRIVPARVNMDTLLHDRIRAGAQCLSSLISTWLDLRALPRRGLRGH
jgi:hypothetical protein